MYLIIGILIPFIGTTLGSSMVFFMKKTLNKKTEKLLLGFASGVMIAASIWSLLIPSMNMAEESGISGWIPASLGFLSGVLFLLFLDNVVPMFNIENNENKNNDNEKFKKTLMMIIAITLHNIPEGMAVGVIFAGVLMGSSGIALSGAFTLAIGIAIQNFPEGAIVSMPLRTEGTSKLKSFIYGTLSGIVEPIAAFITILLTSTIVQILPFLLAFAAGAMINVVVEELIPDSQKGDHSKLGTIGVTIGFLIMMILDVTLG